MWNGQSARAENAAAMPHDPLILTAAFDAASAALFQRLRDRHFPERLNIVPAHLTLFHHLPGAEQAAIDERLRTLAAGERPLPFAAAGLRFLGRGVALEIEAPHLPALRRTLSEAWRPWLTAQDGQGFRPHVTVQNKADPAAARALRDALAADFPAVDGTIVGFDLWHYRGGPWERAGGYRFAD